MGNKSSQAETGAITRESFKQCTALISVFSSEPIMVIQSPSSWDSPHMYSTGGESFSEPTVPLKHANISFSTGLQAEIPCQISSPKTSKSMEFKLSNVNIEIKWYNGQDKQEIRISKSEE